MARRDAAARVLQISAGEALALQLAHHAAAVAGAAVRELGYPRPTDEQWRRISHAITQEALAAGLLIPGAMPEITDEQLDEAAELTGLAAVRDVLGHPPAMALN